MWWRLPNEIVEEIIQYISFDDYVALTQTNRELRHILDNYSCFQLVLEANIGEQLRGHDLNFLGNKVSVWKILGRLRAFLNSVDSIYPTDIADPYADARLRNKRDVIIQFAIDQFVVFGSMVAFFLELKEAEAEFEQNVTEALKHPKTFSVSRIFWLKKLLQLQEFGITVEFALNYESDQQSSFCSIETCYFELSRCHIDFIELVKYREITLSKIRADLRSYLPASSDVLKFQTKASYHSFIRQVIKTIVGHLKPKNFKPGFAGNILRIYKGLGGETMVPYLAIIAKILDEEIFDRFSFDFAGEICSDPNRYITPMFLVLGKDYVLIDLETGLCQFYDEETIASFPDILRPHMTDEVTVDTVIQRAFESEESRLTGTSEFLQQDWHNMHYSTSIIKLRFLRTLLLELRESYDLNESDFRPLIQNTDFFLFFHTARKVLADREDISSLMRLKRLDMPSFHKTTEFFECVTTKPYPQEFTFGDIVVNQNAEFFAVVLGPEPQSDDLIVSTLMFDNIEETSSLLSSLSNVRASNFGSSFIPFLKWLISTDGISHAGMFMFPNLKVTGEKLTFVSKEPSRAG